MTKWAVTNKIEYPTDTIALCSQKARDEFELVYNLLNRLRNLDASNGTPTDAEPYQLHVNTATNKLEIRNAANSSWIELGKIDENYFGLTPEDISAVKNTGTVSAIYSGNDSAKPTSNLKAYDLYFAFDSKKLYYWTGTTWQLFLSLNFENLLNYADYCVLKSEVGYNGKNKVLRLDATTGLANVSISGSAPQVDGKKFSFSNPSNGDVIIYNSTTNSFVNSPKSSALSDYVLQSDLEPYATTANVTASLSAYTNTAGLNTKLANYALKSDVATSLESYEKTSAVDLKIADLNSAVSDSLTSYAKTSDVNTKILTVTSALNSKVDSLKSSVATSLGAYTKTADLNAQLENYVLTTDMYNVLMDYETVDDFNNAIADYVTSSDLASSLSDYSTTAEINASLESYVSDSELAVTLSNYSTTDEINSSLAAYPTTSEVSTSLSSYVTNDSLTSALADYSPTADIASSLSGYVTSETLNAYAKKVDVASSLTLYVKTAELATATVAKANKADKFSSPMSLKVTGQAVGNVSFDGSGDAILNLNVSNATSANSANSAITALTASSANKAVLATKAEQDGNGNNIASTYATKNELNNLAAKMPSFSFAMNGGVLTITDGTNSYQFVGTAV